MNDLRIQPILNCTNHLDTPIVNLSGLCRECWQAKLAAENTCKHNGSCCDTLEDFMAEKRKRSLEALAADAQELGVGY